LQQHSGDLSTPTRDDTNLDKQELEYYLWHRRFAHLGVEKIRTLHTVTTLSKPISTSHNKTIPYEVCSLTKIRNRRGQTTQRKAEVLQLVHIDIYGLFEPTRNEERYFLHILDNHLRMIWIYLLKSRDEALNRLILWRTKAERESDTKLKAVRSDNAPELMKILKQWET
jgi:hypothetical protein